jgi:membrane protein
VGTVSVSERLDAYQQRHPGVGFPLAVVYKFTDDQGGYLAALITYYGFLSVFPLLLLLSSVLGFVLQGNPDLQKQILDSALAQFPVIGQELGNPEGLRGSTLAVVIGLVSSLYGALGVAQATQNAMNTMWAVPRNRRPNPITSRLRSLLLLGVGGLTFLLTSTLSGFGTTRLALLPNLHEALQLAATGLAMVITAAFFVFLFRWATPTELSRLEVLPGAIAAAMLWQLLQTFGATYVREVVSHANSTNGVFAIVLGLIAYVYLATVSLLLCSQANVVRIRRLYPRTLLTPFTDDVDLTDADQRAYTSYARAQRTKEFESVEVSFENDGQNATFRRRRKAAKRAAEAAAQELEVAAQAENAARDEAIRARDERAAQNETPDEDPKDENRQDENPKDGNRQDEHPKDENRQDENRQDEHRQDEDRQDENRIPDEEMAPRTRNLP